MIGNEIILKADDQALKYIFGDFKKITKIVRHRLLRWSWSGFHYTIKLVPSSKNGNSDALSRLPISDTTGVFDSGINSLNFIRNDCKLIDIKMVQKFTHEDKILNKT